MAKLLPPNASALEQALEQAGCQGIDNLSVPVNTLWNPLTCPEACLPWLAWTLSVDHWEADWDEATRRRVLQESIPVHRGKGTRAAILRVLTAAGYDTADIVEGPDDTHPQAHWASWRVRVDQALTVTEGLRLRQLLSHVAPARCQLIQIEFKALNRYDGSIRYDGQHTFGTHGIGTGIT